MALLECTDLAKRFGGVTALDRVSFSVEEGVIVGLIGPNGAGKTTLFNLVAGALKPDSGRVAFAGSDITGLPANEICRRGIARTFQVTRPFACMSCVENVAVAVINSPRYEGRVNWRRYALDCLEIGRTGFDCLYGSQTSERSAEEAARDSKSIGHQAETADAR